MLIKVRIEGIVEVLAENLADKYWKKRPLDSRIGSKLSAQSSLIPNRDVCLCLNFNFFLIILASRRIKKGIGRIGEERRR